MSAPAWRLQPMRVCAHTSGGLSQLPGQPRFWGCQYLTRRCCSCFCSEQGAMVLPWTRAGAVALLEQNGLALCVGLALEMRCTLCSSVQLCRC